jgi:hypothetical protein
VRGGGDDVLHPDAEERELKERKSYFIGVCGGKSNPWGNKDAFSLSLSSLSLLIFVLTHWVIFVYIPSLSAAARHNFSAVEIGSWGLA